jgi:hypothetical protein
MSIYYIPIHQTIDFKRDDMNDFTDILMDVFSYIFCCTQDRKLGHNHVSFPQTPYVPEDQQWTDMSDTDDELE